LPAIVVAPDEVVALRKDEQMFHAKCWSALVDLADKIQIVINAQEGAVFGILTEVEGIVGDVRRLIVRFDLPSRGKRKGVTFL